MNGVHDMGGMTDFGPIPIERSEPTFHAEWEERVFGLVRHTIDPLFNWDEFRFAIERLDPVVYLSASYYERWLAALERYLIEKQVISAEEMRKALADWSPEPGRDLPVPAVAAPETPVPTGDREEPRYVPGSRVRARNLNPPGHTRLPRYVRGKVGTVERMVGVFTFPDANALGLARHVQPVYAVRFEANELWGSARAGAAAVHVDLWEEYLEPAAGSHEGAAL